MPPSTLTRSFGLVLAGFLLGVIVTGLNRNAGSGNAVSQTQGRGQGQVQGGTYQHSEINYQVVAQTGVWDILVEPSREGRSVALGQNGLVRVVVRDDQSALYVMTYKEDDPVWQGRLMDVGNDGSIEVADLSYGHCEAFSPPSRL